MIFSARMSSGSATRKRTCASRSFRKGIPTPPNARPSSREMTRSGNQARRMLEPIRRLRRSRDGRARRVLRRSWYSGPPRTSENSSESSASGRSLMGSLNSSQRGFQRTWAYVAFQSPSPDRPDEGRIVALHLIGVRNGVVANRLVKLITLAQIPRDHGGIPGLVVSPGEHQAAEGGVRPHQLRGLGFDGRCNLHVPELADIEGAAGGASRPGAEDAARGLHQTLPDDDALPAVRNAWGSGVRLEHRAAAVVGLQPVFVRRLDQRHDVALVTLSENDLAVRQSGALAP